MKKRMIVVWVSTRYAFFTVDPIRLATTKRVASAPCTSNPTYGVCQRGWMRPNAAGRAPSTPATNGSRAEPASHAPTPPRLPSASRIATIAATGASQGAPSRSTSAAVACGIPFVMLTVVAGRATSIAAVPSMYSATMANPETTMPVALPATTVSITNGMPQATAALVDRLGVPWLAPIAAVVAILLALGNLGGVGAWLAGSARLPFVAGLDGALPAAFGRIHPRWQTPYVGLLVQGALATLFVVASLIGSTVKNAYLVLTQTTLILFFIPYLYLFAAYLRLRRTRTAVTALIGE